jgi:hypothetical protein
MDILGYESSEKFERFYDYQKEFLGIDDIAFVPIRKHPNQNLYGTAYGTIFLVDDGRRLKVFLNPRRFELHPVEERAEVAEVTAVHEILHQWTKAKGYPLVRGDKKYLQVTNWFTNVFHHLVVNEEMDRLGFDYRVLDRFVADEFIFRIEKQKQREAIPTYTPESVEFSLYTLWYTHFYFQFSEVNYTKARSLIVDSNENLLKRSDKCIKEITASECWKSSSIMFYTIMTSAQEDTTCGTKAMVVRHQMLLFPEQMS